MKIRPVKRLMGEIDIPGDKSISHRAIMLGSLAKGETRVKGIQDSDDCNYTAAAFTRMGIEIEKRGEITAIKGKGLKGLQKPAGELHVGNSGTTMRILAGILAGQDFEATLTGDESLSRRPMKRIVEPLSLMGVDIKAKDGEYPPLTVKGGAVKAINYKMPVPSAQVKSAVLFAGLYSDGTTRVTEEFRSRDHTERMMEYFGVDIEIDGTRVSVTGGKELTSRYVEVPGDISSASFFVAAATLLHGSKVMIKKVGMNPTRSAFIDVLARMGAHIAVMNRKALFEPVADIEVESSKTCGIVIEKREIPAIIDELPVIFVVASLSEGRTVIEGAGELRVKETDRIRSMQENLAAMGARFSSEGDNIIIDGVRELKPSAVKAYGDHRTCMSMAVAALAAQGESEIDDVACVGKSFPGFFQTLEELKQ